MDQQNGLESAAALRRRMRGVPLKREPLELALDGETVTVDVHEVTSGEKLDLGDLARAVNERKVAAGTRAFVRKLLSRTVHVHGSSQKIWETSQVEEIDDLSPDIVDALVKKAMTMNGLDKGAAANAKNDSGPVADSSSTGSESAPAS